MNEKTIDFKNINLKDLAAVVSEKLKEHELDCTLVLKHIFPTEKIKKNWQAF